MTHLFETLKTNSKSKQNIDELEKSIIGLFEVLSSLQTSIDNNKLQEYKNILNTQNEIIDDIMASKNNIPTQINETVTNKQLINIELPTFDTENNELIKYYSEMMNDYLMKNDERYKYTLLNTMMRNDNYSPSVYKNNDHKIYSQYEHGTSLWNIFMYMQKVLIPNWKCHVKKFAKVPDSNHNNNSQCGICRGIDFYAASGGLKNHNNQDFHINALLLNGLYNSHPTQTYSNSINRMHAPKYSTHNVSHKLFTLKSYEILLNALSFNGMHADIFEDPFKNFINVDIDKTIKYNYKIEIYRIYKSIYYDFHTIEPKEIDMDNIWHISDIIDDGCTKSKIQLFIYKTQL
jgi:hypothetical protein